MKIKLLILSLCIIFVSFMGIPNVKLKASAPLLLFDDTPVTNGSPIPDDYQFGVMGTDHSVVGIRPASGDNFDIEAYTDTTFTTMFESSTSTEDNVDFIVLDKTAWMSPPNRGARVTSGTRGYVIEMENDVEDYLTTDSWSGTMDSFPGNPVLDRGPPGSWDDDSIGGGDIHYDGTTYHAWYTGGDGSYARIGYATSPDGITWTKHPSNPVVDIGSPGSWDDKRAMGPTVVYDGTTYHMWYSGSDNTYRIGYATSPDGIAWTKSLANPVLNPGPGSWDSDHVSSNMVFYDGITYHMWYAGRDGLNHRIGYATSPDGISWTKSASNPVLNLGPSGSWDDDHVITPRILYNATTSTYEMWYTGSDGLYYRVGYATSPDGISWTKYAGNLCPGTLGDGCVFDLGLSGSWDDFRVAVSTVFYNEMTYHMWYVGMSTTFNRLGYATSQDGINWTRYTYTEVLDAYQILGITIGMPYTITLDVPATIDLDLFIFDTTGGRDDAIVSSTNIGAGIDESIAFIAPVSGDYLLVITNEDGGTGTYFLNQNLQPVADPNGPYIINEGNQIIFDGTSSYDSDGTVERYDWDLNGDGTFETTDAGSTLVTTWGDDYNGTVGLKVQDNTGLWSVPAYTNVTVNNVAPDIINLNYTIYYFEPRTQGYWKHQCKIEEPYGDHVGIQDEYIETIAVQSQVFFDVMSKDEVCAILDPPDKSIMKDKAKLQLIALWLNIVSGKLSLNASINLPTLTSSNTLNEVIDEIEDTILNSDDKDELERVKDIADSINNGIGITTRMVDFEVMAWDPGSDDLTFEWDFGDGSVITKTYFNEQGNNPPPDVGSPDPYPSSDGTFPFSAQDITSYSYVTSGSYTLKLKVTDDDAGTAEVILTLIIN